MKKMLRKSKGFTLVELLIVIIIIGILAGMMMLSTGSATDKAEATKIVSDMRNIKTAALLYYIDNSTWPSGDITIKSGGSTSFDKYLDRKPTQGYKISNSAGSVNVTCGTDNTKFNTQGVKDALKATAKDAGLYSAVSGDSEYAGGDTVYMRVK